MNFTEALAQLQLGKYVKRSSWEDGYCALMPSMNSIWRILIVPNPNAGNYLPLLADLLADDWEVLPQANPVVAPAPVV